MTDSVHVKINPAAGERFASLSVISEAKKSGKHRAFLCVCDCGMQRKVRATDLNSGLVISCVRCASVLQERKRNCKNCGIEFSLICRDHNGKKYCSFKCFADHSKESARKNREDRAEELTEYFRLHYIANKDRISLRHKAHRLKYRAENLIGNARSRARKFGIPFSITEEDMEQLQATLDSGCCSLSGTPLNFTSDKRVHNSPSLDKIIPSLGYVSGNVRIICWALNLALSNYGEDAIAPIMEAWISKRLSSVLHHTQETESV